MSNKLCQSARAGSIPNIVNTDMHIPQLTLSALISLRHNVSRIGLNFVYYIICIAQFTTWPCAYDNTSAGDSYSGSSAEIAHTSSESEAQISNKTV